MREAPGPRRCRDCGQTLRPKELGEDGLCDACELDLIDP